MRFGLHVKETGASHAEVIMDWPDKGRARPFDSEYSAAFSTGRTSDDKVHYHCGPLKDLGFTDHVLYGSMHHSTLLQLSDLVVGACRELVECCLGKRSPGPGVECLRIVRARFRGYPKEILGRGISIATKDERFRTRIKDGIKRLVFER
jgi:hypothetical protein